MTDRLGSERAFHDRQALDRSATFAAAPHRLHFSDNFYLDHETWVRPAFAALGDVAVFCEPWGDNPLLEWARTRLPYPGKGRTRDERPLRDRDLRVLRRVFPGLHIQGFQLLSMLRRVLRPGRLTAALERCDAVLLRLVPGLRRFCRYAVLTLRR